MPLLKPKPEPTFEERLNAANATAMAALSVFELAATDLERAANEKEVVAIEVSAKREELIAAADDLLVLEAEALAQAGVNYDKATKIRSFVGN